MTDVESHIRGQIELRPVASRGALILPEGEAPAPAHAPFHARYSLFLWAFAAPMLAAALYLFVIASDRFVSEAQFVVRAATSSGAASTAALVESRGLTRARDETYVVAEYIRSRDALDWLLRKNDLRAVFSRPEGDFLNRFPNFYTRDTLEEYFKYYTRMIAADIDGATGIGTISVVAFTPEDAQAVAGALLKSAEELINRLNERAHTDALAFAGRIVADARRKIEDVENRIADYRGKIGMIDPAGEMTAAFETITKLSTELSQIEASLQQQRALTPNSPAIAGLRQKAESYRAEIARRRGALAGADGSIAAKMSAYDQLMIERTIAEKSLSSAEASYEQARQNSEKQQLYLQTVVEPNRPDQAKYPRRVLWFFGCAAVFGVLFFLLRSLQKFAAEHAV